MNFKYRSEIDGLRAIAVIPVILFHAGFTLFSGGYTGVDVFFVISGYLITSIILKDLDNGTFTLKNFYERRSRRILPLLIFVILITSVLSFIFLTKSELASYFKSVNATLFFYANFYFWKTAPYFDSEADLEPLLHTWSLSIEEQFYIIFPITLIFLHNILRKYIFLFFISGFFISLFFCQIFALKTTGNLNFYFTFTRIWELFLGSICAYIILYKKRNFSNFTKNLLSIIGTFLILFSIFYFDKQTIYPSFYTLIPTMGTALIILFADNDTIIKKILSFKIFVLVGLISYSLYLWHQPLLVFGRIFFEDFLPNQKLIIIIITFLLSFFSYFFIEIIFRGKNEIKLKNFVKFFFLIIILLFIFTSLSINFFSSKNSTEVMAAKLLVSKNAIYSTEMDERQFIKNRIIYETMDPKILIMGSSRLVLASNEDFNEQILNLSVSGATLEDHLALVEMSLEKFSPNIIILGADPWLFNKKNNQLRWKSISDEFKLSRENIILMKKKNKILNNYNLDGNFNFYENILEKIYNFLNIRKLEVEIKKDNTKNSLKHIILKDGSRLLSQKKTNNEIKTKVIEYSMKNYSFSSDNYNIYKKFIQYLIDIHNKKVILFLSPYHLKSYELTVNKKAFYLDLEKKFLLIGKELNVQIVGSYNSSKTLCTENEFRDYMHPKKSCIKKIINQIK